MAGYLASQFPGDYYSGDEAKSLDFIGYFDNQRQKESARQNQELNRQMALDEMFAQQQQRPLDLRRKELDNQGLENLLPAKEAEGKLAQRNLEIEQGIPVEQRRQAVLGKLAREMQEDELKRYESEMKRMMSDPMVSRNPNAKAFADRVYSTLYDVRREQAKLSSAEERAAIAAASREAAGRESTSRQLSVIRARAEEARKTVSHAKKDPATFEAAAIRLRELARVAEDEATQLSLLKEAETYETAAQQLRLASKAGQPTITPEGGIGSIGVKPQLGARPQSSQAKPGSSKDNPIVLK